MQRKAVKKSGKKLGTYYARNRKERLEYQHQYNSAHRGRVYSSNRNRELNELYGTPIQTDPEQIKLIAELYDKAIELTNTTGTEHVVDHVYPASKGGLHAFENLQVITASENSQKYHKVDKHLPDLRTTSLVINIKELNLTIVEEDKNV